MKSVLSLILTLLTGMLIFVGIPLLAWDVREWLSFLEDPARTAYVVIIFLLQILAVGYNPRAGRNKEKRKDEVARHRVDLYLIQLFSLAIVFLAPFSDRRSWGSVNWGDSGRYAGLILVVAGFVLMQMAEKYLAKQFSVVVTVQENHQLIETGPYRFIRHPRYLGVLLFFVGISMTFRSYVALGLVLALLLILLWRVYAEEALMRREFGKAWEAYRVKSWRLIPFVF